MRYGMTHQKLAFSSETRFTNPGLPFIEMQIASKFALNECISNKPEYLKQLLVFSGQDPSITHHLRRVSSVFSILEIDWNTVKYTKNPRNIQGFEWFKYTELSYFLEQIQNACMIPPIPIKNTVKSKLIKKSIPRPFFNKTAIGGRKIQRIIVRISMIC